MKDIDHATNRVPEPAGLSGLSDVCRKMSDSEKLSVLKSSLFAGLSLDEFVLTSVAVLAPDKLEPLAALTSTFFSNPLTLREPWPQI